jgi:biotin carboxyl carrier protein
MQYSAPAAAYPAAAPAPAPTPAVTQPQRGAADGNVTSPIAGTVIETKVKSGDNVKEGDLLLVIEAMKMNTSITAPKAGTVKTINVKKGRCHSRRRHPCGNRLTGLLWKFLISFLLLVRSAI